MGKGKVFEKTSAEIESFGIDYTDRLSNEIIQNDTISTSVWSVPAGITSVIDAVDQNSTRVTIKVSGGTDGENYVLLNTITTNGGRTLADDIIIRVRD